ncbi:hypothetical protein SAMN05216360_10396 [Methylobacterium phyllostachyos]|uniref:Uncharacterized protein n=1 Tax=Methylobacterium phyllostachyos TaxID=582672 RepID=A0A1G9V7Q9_9HYPH|nr:hypothetical protein [Methylobacterium phyllostachyos]SDM68130.1 hypothetical protein SAMN05216360_10396 [Methylobacterium phyllostachyos]
MTLEDVKEVTELAARRAELLHEADDVETRGAEAAFLFGHKFDLEMEDVLRMALAGELRRRAGVSEARLRELGVTFPGDALPEVDPGPKHAFLSPNSWDPETGQFTVWVPCTPARSWRKVKAKADGDIEVDEALNPHGLERDGDELATVTVEDATDPYRDWPRCGLVVGSTATDQGVEIRVRLHLEGPMRGAIASGLISAVGIGYEGLEETIVSASGDRPLVNVHRWRLHEIRLHRATAQTEPAWPNGCLKPGSCSRHASCMYGRSKEQCVHFGRDLTDDVSKAKAA